MLIHPGKENATRHARQTYAHYQQLISECDQEIEARIRAFENTADPPAATTTDHQPPESPDAPPKPPEPTAQPFNVQAHLTRLFGTDLTLIPGIGVATAQLLFSELGPDLSRFPNACSFAASVPTSGPRRRSPTPPTRWRASSTTS